MVMDCLEGSRSGGASVAVGGAGFEPAKAEPSDLQSDPFDRSGNPPYLSVDFLSLASSAPELPSPVHSLNR